ncbi:uncharacterized protein LOC144923010 [Branchiostoma floridae x Branchiostoma belcheri]
MALSGCLLNITSTPDDCMTLSDVLSDALPTVSLDGYSDGVASDLFDVAVSEYYVDRCEGGLSVSAGTTDPVVIVDSLVTLDEFSVDVTSSSSSPFNALFKGVWTLADLNFNVTLEKSEDGFVLTGVEPDVTSVSIDRIISGLSSLAPGNTASELLQDLALDIVSGTGLGVNFWIDNGFGPSFELNFDTATPFEIGNGLIRVSGSGSEEEGPGISVGMGWDPPHAELFIDASVTALGIHANTTISMDAYGTYFDIEGSFLDLFSASLGIEANYGSLNDTEFSVTGTFNSDLSSALEDKVDALLDNVVKEAKAALGDAGSVMMNAHQACDDAMAVFNTAQIDADSAQLDFENAFASLISANHGLETEKAALTNAVADLFEKQQNCQFRECGFFDVACIAYNAGLAVCQAGLEVAKATVEAAKQTLNVAQLTATDAQEVENSTRWTLDAANAVLEQSQIAVNDLCDFGVQAARETLFAAEDNNTFGIQVAEKVGESLNKLIKEATEAVDGAHNDVSIAQQACDAARANFDSAQADFDSAQSGYENAIASFTSAKLDLQTAKAAFDSALADLDEKQRNCDALDDCPWYDIPCHTKRAACLAALEVAKVAVEATRNTLTVAEAVNAAAKQEVDNSKWTLEAARAILEASQVAAHESCDIGVAAALATLNATLEANSFGLEVSQKVEEDIFVKEAKKALDNAHNDVSIAEQACADAARSFNFALADVNTAQDEYDNAVANWEALRHQLETEQTNVDNAVAALNEKLQNCESRDCSFFDVVCVAEQAVCNAGVEVLKTAVHAAETALNAAQLAFNDAQALVDNSLQALNSANDVWDGTKDLVHDKCDVDLANAQEAVVAAQEMSEKATLRAQGGMFDIPDMDIGVPLLSIQNIAFNTSVAQAETGIFDGVMTASFFGGNTTTMGIPINVFSIENMASSIIDNIADFPDILQPAPQPTTLLNETLPPTTQMPEALPPNILLEAPPQSGGILPELQQLLTGPVEDSYTVSADCSVNLALSVCRLDITSTPDDCLTVRLLLSDVLPNLSLEDYSSGVASDLFGVAVSSCYVDRCEEELSVSGGSTQPIVIVPSLVTLNGFSVDVTYIEPSSSFNALFSGMWNIGDVNFNVTLEKSDDGFTLSGSAAEISVTTNRLIFGLSSFVPGNDVNDLFSLMNLGSISVTDVNVEVKISDNGYSMKLDFKTNILDSQVFFFLSSTESDDGSSNLSFSLGMSVKSVLFGDLIRDVVDENVVVPILSDLDFSEAALLATTRPQEANFPNPLLNDVATEISSGLGVAFTMKLSEDVPFGTFFLGVDGSTFKFKVLSEGPIPVSVLVSKVISSFSSISLPSQLTVADILAGSLKSFEYNADNDDMSVSAAIDDSIVIVPNILTLDDLSAAFDIKSVESPPATNHDFSFELNSVWDIGGLEFTLSIAREPVSHDISAKGSLQDDLPVGSLIQQFGVSFLPSVLNNILQNAGFDSFEIADPSVSIIMGDDWSVHVSGTAVINTWQCSVETLVGRVTNDLVMAAGITLSSVGIIPAVKGLTGGALDIGGIPGASILSNAQVAFVISAGSIPADQGLTISSPLLADVNIVEGVNLAASLTLPTDCGPDDFCKVNKRLLGADIELKLFASLTTASDLHLKAVVGTPVTISDGIVMQNVGFEIFVGTKMSIGITGSLEFETPPVTLTGGIGLSESGVYLQMSTQGMWNQAFGLDFLSIGNINLEVSIAPEPTVISSLQFGGRAVIGYQNDPSATPITGEGYIGVDIVNPGEDYCMGSVSALTIPAVLSAFGQNLQLPSFLSDIGFPQGVNFSFSPIVQTLPNGVTIQQGFFFSGTMEILFFSVSADLKVDTTSLYASVTVTPFTIGNDLIQVSGSSSDTGPVLLVDIGWDPLKAELRIDGSVSVLGIQASTTITMDSTGTRFSIEGNFLNIFSASLDISANYGSLREADFMVAGTFKNDLFSTLQGKIETALNNIMNEANSALEDAKNDVAEKQQACDDARGPFNDAQAAVDSKKRDFDNAVAALQAEKAKFDSAVQSLDDKQQECDDMDCAWYNIPCQTEKGVCIAALEIAKGAVEVGKGSLSAAQGVVDASKLTLDAAIATLEATSTVVHETCDVALVAAEETLTLAEEANKFGTKIAEKVVDTVFGTIDIQELGFSVEVAVAQTGHFDGWMVVSFFHEAAQRYDITFQLLSIDDMVNDIVDIVENYLGV